MTEEPANISLRIRNVTEINETPRPVKVKEEPVDEDTQRLEETQLLGDDPGIEDAIGDSSTIPTQDDKDQKVPFAVKEEPKEDVPSVEDPPPAPESPEPPKPPSRPCCRYGIKCYRKNTSHRESESHPGDSDYKMPDYPAPPPGTPQCPYGRNCYRRNPLHFQQFSHTGTPPKPSTRPPKQPPAKRRRRDSRSEDSETDSEMDDFLADDESDEDPYADYSEEDDYNPDDDDPDASY